MGRLLAGRDFDKVVVKVWPNLIIPKTEDADSLACKPHVGARSAVNLSLVFTDGGEFTALHGVSKHIRGHDVNRLSLFSSDDADDDDDDHHHHHHHHHHRGATVSKQPKMVPCEKVPYKHYKMLLFLKGLAVSNLMHVSTREGLFLHNSASLGGTAVAAARLHDKHASTQGCIELSSGDDAIMIPVQCAEEIATSPGQRDF